MNITDVSQKNLGINGDKTDPKAGKKPDAAPAANAGSADSVTLSPMSAQLKSLEAKVGVDNVYDAEKVEAIKLAISSGQFQIHPEKIADGLIDTVKDLLGRQK